ncbi:hypothetical protein ACFVL4_20960 [Bacillus subtilis]|nr:hypothetical protein [Bacillus subtilis]ODV47818.1 hypothetical protein BCM26_10020 [Bacillus subtilis]OTQ81886.1 hypothetical protein BG31_23225 [Bacillus subtilis subsp. subtilis]
MQENIYQGQLYPWYYWIPKELKSLQVLISYKWLVPWHFYVLRLCLRVFHILMDTIETKTNDATTNTVPINDSLKLITMKLENINKGIFVTITVKM